MKFISIEQFREHYFPVQTAKEREEAEIERIGWGAYSAKKAIDAVDSVFRKVVSTTGRE